MAVADYDDDYSDRASEVASVASVDTPPEDEPKNADEDSSGEKIIVGMVVDTKDVFAKFDSEGNQSWSDKPPPDLEEAPENETTKKFAIIVRKSTYGPMKPTCTTYKKLALQF